MTILTDILSLIRRGIFASAANPDDVIVLGVNEEPVMTGVASPIPYKSVKVIKVKDLKISPAFCGNANTPETPAAGTGQVFQKQIIDPTTNVCTNYFRSLKSISSNLTLEQSADNNYVEIRVSGEPNTAANVGTGVGVYRDKVGETLNFKSLISSDSSVSIVSTTNEIDLTTTGTGLTSVGLSMPSAFTVTNTPLTANGSLSVAGAGSASQVVLGDGTLGNLPTSSLGPIGYFSFDQSSTINSTFTSDLAGITITYSTTGQWIFAWTTPLSSTNYIVNVSSNDLSGAAQVWANSKTTSGFRVSAANGVGTPTDMKVNVVIYK